MALVLIDHKEHRTEPLDPSAPVTFETTERQETTPDGGQIMHISITRRTDADGLTIHENSLLVRCERSGEIVHAQHSFRCRHCHYFYIMRHRGKRIRP